MGSSSPTTRARKRQRKEEESAAENAANAEKIIDYYKNRPIPNPLSQLKSGSVKRDRKSREMNIKMKSAVLDIAPAVVAVSTFMGVQRKLDSSGLVIAWNEGDGEALILTSAKVVRLPEDGLKSICQVFVRLENSKILLARQHCVDFQHNLAVLKVLCNEEIKSVTFDTFYEENLAEGMDVVGVGRDFLTCNLLSSAGSLILDYPYFGCEGLTSSSCVINKVSEGGPLLDSSGRVLGINFFNHHDYAHPLPSRLFLERLKRSIHGDIAWQPWFGLTLVDSDQLPVHTLEKLSNDKRQNVILVKEVFDGSPAKKFGVQPGDHVICYSGICVEDVRKCCAITDAISREVSACGCAGSIVIPNEMRIGTHDFREIMLLGDILPVSDRKFCCCWPMEERFWYRKPLEGSQTDPYQKGGIYLNRRFLEKMGVSSMYDLTNRTTQ